MPADPYTPAELEAGAEAIREWRRHSPPSILDQTAAVLRAVLPLHAARVRAETADELDDALDDGTCGCGCTCSARVHATTPGDDHA